MAEERGIVEAPGAERQPPVTLTKGKNAETQVIIRGPVLVNGDHLDATAPAALVVEKYDSAEYEKGEGTRIPFEVSIDNER